MVFFLGCSRRFGTSRVPAKINMIIDGGYCPPEPTTVIDLSGDSVEIIRQGAGDTSLISV
jgi:tRNA A37 threonylcarbamoyladenosine synthetase subunit TsaC/SUA5/YrdC